MIKLRKTEINELPTLYKIGIQEHAKTFLNIKSMLDHQREFTDKNTRFLNILNTSNVILGYFILVKDLVKKSIQLKRILICKEHLGIGQDSLISLEKYCITEIGINHIWLDVYDNNYRAIHIYKKLGYKLFNTLIEDNRKILYYDKLL
ncbi:MAG: hypothetical protein COA79_22530 [Planctomycetota bacterium]|nr:MAG: hypothetical protein COA79_22530 [Planctomycetota bacterium]